MLPSEKQNNAKWYRKTPRKPDGVNNRNSTKTGGLELQTEVANYRKNDNHRWPPAKYHGKRKLA